MNRIESASNPVFKRLRTLTESKGIKKEGMFFVYGKNPIDETFKAAHAQTRLVLATQEQADEAHRLNRLLPKIGETIFLSKALFEELNLFGIDYPLLVCAAPKWETWDRESGPAVVCPFQNPQNLGGALRSALAFGLKVILTKESAHPLHPKCVRALSGNIFAHDIEAGPSLKDVEVAKNLIVLDPSGEDISQYRFPKDAIFLIGEEGKGVPEKFTIANRVSIPITQRQESLNAMAALSIAAYQFRVQHPLAHEQVRF